MTDSQSDSFYVTTPIYYVNDKPHIGHAYTTILADVLARYHRLLGQDCFFLTGTDEHGQKVQQAAAARSVEPQAHVDEYVVRFQELWQRLEITHDDFIRTTEPRHKQIVQAVLQDLYDRDEIYRADYDGWYCVTCERFYTEKDLIDGNCPEDGCGKPVERIRESNYFFRMSKYQDWLVEYIESHPEFIQPDHRRNETLGFLKKPLTDLCISRPKHRLSWGIELPFDHDYVTYVWFDALLNYVTAIGYGRDIDQFARWWPATIQLIGKDILTTHTVYWPTMLKAMGVAMPQTVFAHGWWLIGRDKMSKSSGNVVNPMEMCERYGVDAFRYFLMAEMTLGQDAGFTEDGFIRRYNADLANDLGNLLSRLLRMLNSHFDSKVPVADADDEDANTLRVLVLQAAETMKDCVSDMRLDQGLSALAGAVREVNRFLEQQQPWTKVKGGDEDKRKAATVLYAGIESLRIVSGMLYPVMPDKMSALREAIGCDAGEPVFNDLANWGGVSAGESVKAPPPLFPRIDKLESKEKPPKTPKAEKAKIKDEHAGLISFDTFGKLDLRVATIITAEPIEGADKLLKLSVDVGTETRQIVAGIAKSYAPADLPGKHVVLVANLKPAKIRGVVSQGMLLAADDGNHGLELVSVSSAIPNGASVR